MPFLKNGRPGFPASKGWYQCLPVVALLFWTRSLSKKSIVHTYAVLRGLPQRAQRTQRRESQLTKQLYLNSVSSVVSKIFN